MRYFIMTALYILQIISTHCNRLTKEMSELIPENKTHTHSTNIFKERALLPEHCELKRKCKIYFQSVFKLFLLLFLNNNLVISFFSLHDHLEERYLFRYQIFYSKLYYTMYSKKQA